MVTLELDKFHLLPHECQQLGLHGNVERQVTGTPKEHEFDEKLKHSKRSFICAQTDPLTHEKVLLMPALTVIRPALVKRSFSGVLMHQLVFGGTERERYHLCCHGGQQLRFHRNVETQVTLLFRRVEASCVKCIPLAFQRSTNLTRLSNILSVCEVLAEHSSSSQAKPRQEHRCSNQSQHLLMVHLFHSTMKGASADGQSDLRKNSTCIRDLHSETLAIREDRMQLSERRRTTKCQRRAA